MLIGSNFYWNVVTGDTLRGDHGPVAVNSKLGWLLSGADDTVEAKQITHSHVIITGSPTNPLQDGDDVLVRSLQKFWEVESIGIMEPPTTPNESDFFYHLLHLNMIVMKLDFLGRIYKYEFLNI